MKNVTFNFALSVKNNRKTRTCKILPSCYTNYTNRTIRTSNFIVVASGNSVRITYLDTGVRGKKVDTYLFKYVASCERYYL